MLYNFKLSDTDRYMMNRLISVGTDYADDECQIPEHLLRKHAQEILQEHELNGPVDLDKIIAEAISRLEERGYIII